MRFFKTNLLLIAFCYLFLAACTQERTLPILGEKQTKTTMRDGKEVTDTIYFQIPDFRLIDQDSQVVTPENVKDKIYVADFFFTSCPTICPIMKTQMLRIHEHFKGNPSVKLLSHTIDPRHDIVGVLKDYATRLEVDTKQWSFLTGDRNVLLLAQKGYLVSALEDKNEAGGFVHSGAFVLIDKHRHIRGYYDGTKPEKVDLLIKDMELLLK